MRACVCVCVCSVKLDKVEYLVLDEANRVLDMGLLPDVRHILDRCPRKRPRALLGATIPPQIETLIQWAMHSKETIKIGARRSPAETVKRVLYPGLGYAKKRFVVRIAARQMRAWNRSSFSAAPTVALIASRIH